MICEDAVNFIAPYIEDELPEEARRRIETHLFSCRDCAWEAETLRITRRRVREESGEIIASDAFRARVLHRLRDDNPHLNAAEESERLQYQLPIPF